MNRNANLLAALGDRLVMVSVGDPKPKATFGYPDTIASQAGQLSSKTRRLPDGRFEAVAAIFFMGKRGLTVYAVASTRDRARREAEAATETQSLYRRALADGRISLESAS